MFQICLHEGPDCDPDSRDAADTEYLKLFLQTFIRDHFPGVESEVSVEESCIYTMTPDENPVIDLVPDTNIVIAVGFSGKISNLKYLQKEPKIDKNDFKEFSSLFKNKFVVTMFSTHEGEETVFIESLKVLIRLTKFSTEFAVLLGKKT